MHYIILTEYRDNIIIYVVLKVSSIRGVDRGLLGFAGSIVYPDF